MSLCRILTEDVEKVVELSYLSSQLIQMSAPFTIEVCTTADQVEDVFRIREQVFVKDYGYDKDALVDEV